MTVRWTDEVYHIHELEPGKMPKLEEAINFYAPEVRPVIQEAVNKAIKTGQGFDIELPFITAKGNRIWVRVVGKAEMNNGNASRVYGVFQDITKEKEAKAEINKLNEGLEQKVNDRTSQLYAVNKELVQKNIYFNQSLDMLCTATLEGFFQDMNDSFERELGYSKEELKASPFVTFIHPDDVEKTLSEVEKLAARETTLNFENRYRCKNGNYIWLQWSCILFENLLYATARNITLQKNQQVELENQTLKLEQINQELESFTYSVAHDLQAPLRILNGYANVLYKKCANVLDDEAKSLLDTIMRNAKQMGHLIDDLLKLSHLGRKELERRTVDMNKLVEAILYEQLHSNKKGNIEINAGTLPMANCDPGLIRQVWVNLISNAIK